MCLPVALSPIAGPLRRVEYLHDPETEILVARIHAAIGSASSAIGEVRTESPVSVEIEGRDGSWLTLELRSGRIAGIAIAVWPPIRVRGGLQPPAQAGAVDELVSGGVAAGVAVNELSARVVAEADVAGRTVHFTLHRGGMVAERGRRSTLQTVQIAHDVMLEVDAAHRIAGLWLLNVPRHSVPGS